MKLLVVYILAIVEIAWASKTVKFPSTAVISNICGQAIGISNTSNIPNSHLKAVSVYNRDYETYGAHLARLYHSTGYRAQPLVHDNPWIMVDLGKKWILTGIATQGHGDKNVQEWITEYVIMTSSGFDYAPIKDLNGTKKVFIGNNDRSSVKFNGFPIPVIASSVTLYPTKWHRNIALRMELFGCKPGYHIQAMVSPIGFPFDEAYLDATSVDYISLAADIQHEVAFLARTIPGFLSAKVIRFNPWNKPNSPKAQTEAEVEIQCIENTTDYLEIALQEKVAKDKVFLDPKRLYFHHLNDQDYLCDMKINLNPHPSNATLILRTENVSAEAKHQCKIFKKSYGRWEASVMYESSKTFSPLIPLPGNGGKVTIPARRFPPTLIYVRHVLKTEQIEVFSYGLVKIELPPLVVNITGPKEAKKGQGKIILDASKSNDPDTPTDQDGKLIFTWFCKREDDFTYAQYSARRRQRYRFRYLYTKQFMRSIPADVDHGRPFTDDGCFGYGPGRLSHKGPKLEVEVDKMKSKYKYIFKVVVSKGRRKTEMEHTLTINPSVKLKVRCTSNCKNLTSWDKFEKVSKLRNLILDTKCIGRPCPTISSYRWNVFTEQRSRVNGSWWRKVENLNNFIEGLRHQRSLILTSLMNIGNWKIRNQRIKIRATIKITVNRKILEEEDELTLELNSPPRPVESNTKGCELTPSYGKAWETDFHIKCGEWYDEDGVDSFEFRYKRFSNIVIIKKGPMSSASTRLPRGIKEDNDTISVQIKIYDEAGDYTMLTKKAKVLVPNQTDLAEQIQGIIKDTDNDLDIFIKNNQTTSANELAIALCSIVDTSDTKNGNKDTRLRKNLGVTKDVATKLKNKILEKLDASRNTTNWEQTTQILTVVNLATINPEEITLTMQEKALKLLSTTKDFLKREILRNGVLSELAKATSINFIQGIGNLLQSFTYAMRNTPEMDHFKRLRNKQNTEKALQELREIGDTLLTTQKMDEKPRMFNAKTISVIISKNSPSMLRKLSGTPLAPFSGRNVHFPSLGAIFHSSNASSLSSVQSKIIMFTNNPFTWDSTANLVNSWAIDINLYNNGKHFEVTNLNNPIGIFIPVDKPLPNLPIAPNFIKPTTNTSDISRLRYHIFNIQNKHSVVMIRLQPPKGRKLEVFVRALVRPLPWKYNYTTVIPDFSRCQSVVINGTMSHVNCSEDPYIFNISSTLTGKTGKHFVGIRYLDSDSIHQEVRQRLKRDCGSGRRKKRSCVGVKDPPTMPAPTRVIIPQYNKTTDINYTLTISSSACLYWSEREQIWTNHGCKSGPLTVNGSIHCLCNHLTTFGGDFFIQPNPIDFDKVFLTLTNPKVEDFVVMTTVLAIVVLYLIGIIIARRADNNDERKAIPDIYLSDRGDYLYEISVATGVWRGNGTTANVGMILYGDSGYTETITLNDTTLNKKFFARGSINTFMLYLPKGLGNLYKIKIWHDNNGISPAWFLREVEIRDQQDNTEWIFLANKWLALEKGDGEIETEVRAAEKKEIRGFKNVFHSRASNSLADGHLWASVFMRPPQSTFTRVQRLSCCLSIIFATMVTNAMFYQFGSQVHDTFKLGPLKVSWTQVKIGLQSALIAIPVNAIIVTIFRNARPKDNSPEIYQAISTIAKGQKSDKSQGLRHGFVYLGWFLCIGTSIASATVIILYSLSWGGETANEWLTSILVSLVQDIFFTQPIKVILIASLLALLLKKPPDLEKARGSPRWKNKLKQKKVPTLKGEELENARLARKKILKTARAFTEIVTYVLFAILLFIVCYGNRKTTRFDLKDEMVHVMRDYNRVKNISGFWNWTEMIFIPGIYNATWYNGKPFSYDEGFISNRESYLVGMPRIRQLRIQTVKCMIAEDYPVLGVHIPRCLPFYKSNYEYKTKYNKPVWKPINNISIFRTSFDLRKTCPRPWRYQDAIALNALAYKGTYASYSGGGYVADLGYNNKSASRVIDDLKKKEWIDNRTAAVFVELTVFEPATSLYSAVKVLFERLPTGSLKPAIRVEPLTVYGSTDPGFKNVFQTCQLLFVVIVTILFACECFKVYRKGCTYFLRFWSWLDLILITSALLAMGTLFFKEKFVSDFIKGVHDNPFQTTSTDFIVLWSNIEVYLLSFVIFIMTIKFLRLLRFNNHIGNLMLTLKHSTKNLQSFYVVLFIVLIAFTQVGMLLFGKNIENYSSFIGSLSVVLQKLLGTSMQLRKVQRVNKVLGSIYTFAYSVTVAFLLLNVFLSILNTSYKEVRESRRKRTISIALRRYIEDYMKSFFRELMKELHDFEKRWKRKGDMKLEETDNLIDPCKEPLEASDDASFDAGELCYGAEEVFESDPLFELVENEQSDIIRYLVPLATFDNEDDILGELACLEEIKMNLRNIERDLLAATNDEDLSDAVNAEIVDNKSEESFKLGSTLSVYLSVVEPEPEKVVEQVEKDDISLYSVYSNEEGGIGDEQDETEEKDLYNAFHSKSGMYASLNSINELCAKVEQEKSNNQLLSPHRGINLTPRSLRL